VHMAAAEAAEEAPISLTQRPQAVPCEAAASASAAEMESRTTIHAVTGHLLARLAGCGLDDAVAREWSTACTRRLRDHAEAGGEPIRQADIDISRNAITDAGFRSILRTWSKLGLACPLILKAHFNRLTDASLEELARFVQSYPGQLREVHLTNNSFREREAVLRLWRSFAGLPQYPMWVRRQRRFAPVYLRMGRCGITLPEELLGEAERCSLRLCLMQEGCCSKTLCAKTGRHGSGSCPLVHVFGFLDQCQEPSSSSTAEPAAAGAPGSGGAAGVEQAAPGGGRPPRPAGSPERGVGAGSPPAAPPAGVAWLGPEAAQAEPGDDPAGGHRAAGYLCGACGRKLPLDMFSRCQFRKAAAMNAPPAAAADAVGQAEAAAAHLVRRCNDCVVQPCSGCGAELALSRFAKNQMMRPRGQRRCRACTVDTLLCVRCGRPRPREAFSRAQAQKSKALPRVCADCEHINPYHERRYAVAMALGRARVSNRSVTRAALPALPLETIRRIVEMSEPGDEFTKVHARDFHCSLCSRSWSLLTNEVERHVRHSEVHRHRVKRLQDGSLVRIAELELQGLEASRFRDGLGVQGPVCSRERAEEARALVPLWHATAEGVTTETLRVAGLAPGCQWVAPRILEAALRLQLSSGPVPQDSASSSVAEVRSARRRWMLFGHRLGPEAEGHDAEELSAVCAMLAAE